MPPWLPEGPRGEFVGDRRLNAEQMGLLSQWANDGAPEGKPGDLPAPPRFTEGWQLGPPDLVLEMPQTYTLPAEGRDVYRHFVITNPLTALRYVRAMEFRPGGKGVHHAFVRFDKTRDSRRLDAKDPEPGFADMSVPPNAQSPSGHFLGWQPGKVPREEAPGLSWPLEPGSDLVVQLHFQPTGKPEPVRSSIGFYFTERAPTKTAYKIGLTSYDFDLPPGVTNRLVTDSYTLPVDVEVLAVLPHAHYLGRDLQGIAALPDGSLRTLLHIPEWDFNWQGDYRYAKPVFLPKGSTITMQFSYDNSTNNTRNPNQPPRRVQYGTQTTNEMAELWLQLLPRSQDDYDKLTKDYYRMVVRDVMAFTRHRLRDNPNDARAHNQLGIALAAQGKPEALQHFLAAVQAEPDFEEAHYHIGVALMSQGRRTEATLAFERALNIDPEYYKARANLGILLRDQGRLPEAEAQFKEVLRIHPGDPLALTNLSRLKAAR